LFLAQHFPPPLPQWAWASLFYRFIDHTDAQLSLRLLWTSDQSFRRNLYLTTHNISDKPDGIRTHSLMAGERPQNLRFRLHGHWDRRRLLQHHHHHLHHHISVMQSGHLLTRSGVTYPEVSSKVYHDSFCQLGSSV